MRFANGAMVSAVLFFLAIACPCNAIDWKTFNDPKAFLLTDEFAKSISDLPAPEKAEAVKRIHESLKSPEVEVRRRAALTLDCLGDKSGVPTMIEALSKASGRDCDNILVALRILKDKRAIPALRKALHDKSPYVRGIAAASLGELRAAEAYDDLVALTKDKEYEKNDAGFNCMQIFPADLACHALGALGDERAVPILIELLTDKELQQQAAQALEALTKQKFGNDSEKWKAWWKDRSRRTDL